MKILILDDAEAHLLLALFVNFRMPECDVPATERLEDKLRVQFADPLLGGAGYPRTILIRDEGVRPLLMANFDNPDDADATWNQMASQADRIHLVVEEDHIDWPD